MSLILLKALFAGFLRNRHIARHFRRLAMLETVTDTSDSREVAQTLPPTLVAAVAVLRVRTADPAGVYGADPGGERLLHP
ncbi:hypothetical protein KFF47_14295 [Pseudomonas fluorescens]|uniref:hypothetical protein n=1 Tax=Pseudomonas sp. PS01298 TaxID=2991434 RepID=UPI001BCADF7B|nr:hypothetical protein [Pseudomonas sp. PS01298]MBS7843948.1 hypothetical protein [Pseudomonas fluorescens]